MPRKKSKSKYNVADLCSAAQHGDVSRVKKILAAQPDLVNVCLKENDERRALHFAVMARNPEVVEALMAAGADYGCGVYPHRDATGAITIAQERGYEDVVLIIHREAEKRQLAACKNIVISPENDALFAAIHAGDVRGSLKLLDQHPDLLDACQQSGGSVIYTASQQGLTKLVEETARSRRRSGTSHAGGQIAPRRGGARGDCRQRAFESELRQVRRHAPGRGSKAFPAVGGCARRRQGR